MKRLSIEHLKFEELEDFCMADLKDVDGLLVGIDEQLKKFGLELVSGDRGDDNFWAKVQKREEKVKFGRGYERHYREEYLKEHKELKRLAGFQTETVRTHGGRTFTSEELQKRLKEIERLFPEFVEER